MYERVAGGAARADVGQPDEVTWVVMADPEGNEFYVPRPFTAEQRTDLERIRAACSQ